jgi:hypothetical protein
MPDTTQSWRLMYVGIIKAHTRDDNHASSCIRVERLRPTASISSINNMMQAGCILLGLSKNVTHTGCTNAPTNISTNSEPEKMLMKGTPASPATALARSVFPVPGGPSRRTPRGIVHYITSIRGVGLGLLQKVH